MVPFNFAPVALILIASIVVTAGTLPNVLNETAIPYPDPVELVAYALTKYVVLPFRFVRLLTNVPTPAPSEDLLSDIVGVFPVLQHIPLAVTVLDPSKVMFPPLTAEIPVILVIVVVVSVDNFPFPLPFPFSSLVQVWKLKMIIGIAAKKTVFTFIDSSIG